jgi:hypothetical protein
MSVATVPEPAYSNSVVLYHWKKCIHSTSLMPTWRQVRRALPRGARVYEIDVEEHRSTLLEAGVDLGAGVPRVVTFNSEGVPRPYAGERTRQDMTASIRAHLASVSPARVRAHAPATVMYFRYSCGFCTKFLPQFLSWGTRPGSGTVMTVDTEQHPGALSELETPATTVPHVVYFGVGGEQVVFEGERTVRGLDAFLSAAHPDPQHVTFKGGYTKPVQGDAHSRLTPALNDLQKLAETGLGSNYRRTFEPENADVVFVGVKGGESPRDDRMCIVIAPQEVPEGRQPVVATLSGARTGDDMAARIRQVGTYVPPEYTPVMDTNPYVQALRYFGYTVCLEDRCS